MEQVGGHHSTSTGVLEVIASVPVGTRSKRDMTANSPTIARVGLAVADIYFEASSATEFSTGDTALARCSDIAVTLLLHSVS
ncbi:MAG TPA: hypothetical protein VHV51_19915 [Polyangiaceae bacterium]|nr:hypothetical protein [Polyangiaceae bacterium]